MGGAVINADATIGDLAIVNTRAAIDHDCQIGEAAHVAPGAALAGDLLLEVAFAPHRLYRLEGRDLQLDLPVAPWEAALGAKVTVPTPQGAGIAVIAATLSVAGISAGIMYLDIQAMLFVATIFIALVGLAV